MSTRRGFFGLIGGAAAAIALDPDRALWRPGAKLISIPRVLAPCSIDFQAFVDRYVTPAIAEMAKSWDSDSELMKYSWGDSVRIGAASGTTASARRVGGLIDVYLPPVRFRMPDGAFAPPQMFGIPIRWVGHPDGTMLVL